MDFLPLDIVTKSGLKYEVSKDGIVRSVTKNGVIKILKSQGNRVNISGKTMSVSDLIRDAGWLSITETPNTNEEIFESIRKGYQYEIFVGNFGTIKHIFRNGREITKNVEALCNDQKNLDHPQVIICDRRVHFHHAIAEAFVGEIPHGNEIQHIDMDKNNARLGNLRLLTDMKRSGVASFVNRKHEKNFASKKSAILHVTKNGYSNASVEELEASLQRMTDYNIPAILYGRTWIVTISQHTNSI